MKKRLRFLLVTIGLVLMAGTGRLAYAQNPQTIEVGPHVGITSYIGELNTWRHLGSWSPLNQFNYEVGGVVRYNYDSRWAFRLDYTWLKVQALDDAAAWRPEAELHFRTKVHDLSLMVEFNFLNYYTGRPESSFSPYIFAGVSGLKYNPQPCTLDTILAPAFDTWYFRDLMTEDVAYGKYAMSIPFGLGCKLSLSKHLAATLEWRMHYTFTDYLDDVSGIYPADANHAQLLDDEGNVVYDFTDPTGAFKENHQRGNTTTNDWFGMVNLSLTWKFVIPNNSACKMNVD